jgi:hypothetical protein
MPEIHYLVPKQTDGLEKDLTHSIAPDSVEIADDRFVDAKERLLDVNNWNRYSALTGITFLLADGHGLHLKRRARKNDHIRLSLPSSVPGIPGSYDWAKIEAIEYDDYPDLNMETFALRLRPCIEPKSGNEQTVSEFTYHGATATIVIERRGRMIFATYHGRYELSPVHATLDGTNGQAIDVPSDGLGPTDDEYLALIKGFIG